MSTHSELPPNGDYVLAGVYHRIENGVVYAVPTTSVSKPLWDKLIVEYGEPIPVVWDKTNED